MKKSFLAGLALIAALLLLISGCAGGAGGGYDKAASSSKTVEMANGAMSEGTQNANIPALPRKIIYTGNVRMACENLDVMSDKLEASLKTYGAFVGNVSNTGNRGAIREASWTIRVPAEKFDAFIKHVLTLGELQSNEGSSEDVSEEFYDVEARLKNKRIEEARLIELLKKATGKLSEILTVEKELNRVREECERIEGRLRFLRNQTDLSTVTVTAQEVKDFQPQGPPSLKTQISRTFSGSITAMKQIGVGILLFLVAIIPWLLPIGLVVWLVFRKGVRANVPKPPIEPMNSNFDLHLKDDDK
jgi:hypothetical protein